MKKRAEIHKYFIGLKKGLESWLKYMVYVFYAMYLCLNIFSKKILEKKIVKLSRHNFQSNKKIREKFLKYFQYTVGEQNRRRFGHGNIGETKR